ncbi:hypothetical protein FIBSPDRAFT_892193 [Athelia psychrophila]|uniref:Uncharacterized protein n=1 Tax=Athelia psychrophila TaxID=1759441 RepID=A0A166IN90_9AGAM|nr:hypothetical protein FIBSPDRAFT_892193 [Fibularhizoctonia sp. CBS 109695]
MPGGYSAQQTLSQSFFTPQCADLWVSRGTVRSPSEEERSVGWRGAQAVHHARLKRTRQRANEEVLSRITGRVGTIHGNANRHFSIYPRRAHNELMYSEIGHEVSPPQRALPVCTNIATLSIQPTSSSLGRQSSHQKQCRLPRWRHPWKPIAQLGREPNHSGDGGVLRVCTSMVKQSVRIDCDWHNGVPI